MLRGRVAVVTGSTRGTGLRIACKLAAAGADLAINGSGDAAEAENLRQELSRTYGVHVALSSADTSEPYGAARLIGDVTRALGRVDVLVNSAGMQPDAAVQEFPVEQWHSTIASNLTAVFLTTRAVLPQMLERNWGRIINVASVYGLVAAANNAACFASTHGVVGLTKCVALETAHHADRYQVLVHDAARPDIRPKITCAYREFANLRVHQLTIESTWRQLHDLQVRTMRRLTKIFCVLKLEGADVERDQIR